MGRDTSAADEQARVEVSLEDDLYLNDEGDTQTFTIHTNKAWAIQGADQINWISVEPSAGKAGENTITVKVAPNDTYSPREADLTLRCGTVEQSLKFVQVQNDALILSAPSFEMSSDGGEFEVIVKSNIDFTVEIPEDSKDWIVQKEESPSTRALQSHALTFKVNEYDVTDKDREGHVIIKAVDEDKSQTITINQKLLNGVLPNLIIPEDGTFEEAFAQATEKPDTVTMLNIIGEIDSLDLVYIKKNLKSKLLSLRLNRSTMAVSEASGKVRFPKNALNTMTKLLEFTFPNNIEVIGESALNGNTGLRNVLEIPENVVSIEARAFQNTKFGGKLKLPEGLVSIGSSAFNGNTFLSGELVIPAGVKEIPGSAFAKCSGLSGELNIPGTVEVIGVSAFSGCSGFVGELVLPATLQSVGGGAFQDCFGLTSVKFEYQPETLPNGLFSGCSGLTGVFKIPETVREIGTTVFQDCSQLTGMEFPAALTTIGQSAFNRCTGFVGAFRLPENLETIGTNAFQGCNGITSFEFPATLKVIGGFAECTGLEEITLAEGTTELDKYAFQKCTNLKKVTLPKTLTKIGSSAFNGCTALEGVQDIPASVETIGDNAYNGCTSITGVTFHEGLKTIERMAFNNCAGITEINLPATLETIGDNAFMKTKVQTVKFPDGMEEVGGFQECGELTSVYIPKSVKSIGDYAFQKCSKLATIDIEQPSSLEEVGNFALLGIGVTSFVYPETVTKIGMYALSGDNLAFVKFPSNMEDYPANGVASCKALTSFEIPSNVKTLGENFFSSTAITEMVIPEKITALPKGLFYGCKSLKKVTFKGKITSIGSQCFQNCVEMEEFTVPDGITKIENNTFLGAEKMTRLILPETLVTIGGLAFQNMSALPELVIPKGVTSIEKNAFSGVAALTKLTVLAEVPPTITSTTFTRTNEELIVYVPAAYVEAYKANQYWGKLNIQPIQ